MGSLKLVLIALLPVMIYYLVSCDASFTIETSVVVSKFMDY